MFSVGKNVRCEYRLGFVIDDANQPEIVTTYIEHRIGPFHTSRHAVNGTPYVHKVFPFRLERNL